MDFVVILLIGAIMFLIMRRGGGCCGGQSHGQGHSNQGHSCHGENIDKNKSNQGMKLNEIETAKDPICGMYISKKDSISRVIDGQTYYFCSKACEEEFVNNMQHRAH